MVTDACSALRSGDWLRGELTTNVILIVPADERPALEKEFKRCAHPAVQVFVRTHCQDIHVFTGCTKDAVGRHLLFCVFGMGEGGEGKARKKGLTSVGNLAWWQGKYNKTLDFAVLEGDWAHNVSDTQLKGVQARERIFSGCSHAVDLSACLDAMAVDLSAGLNTVAVDASASLDPIATSVSCDPTPASEPESESCGAGEPASDGESDESALPADGVEQPPLGRRKRKRGGSSTKAAEARLRDVRDWEQLHRLYDFWRDELNRECRSDIQLVWQRYLHNLQQADGWGSLGAAERKRAGEDSGRFQCWLSSLDGGHALDRETIARARDPNNQARYRELLAAPPKVAVRDKGAAPVSEPSEIWSALLNLPWFLAAGVAPGAIAR